MILYKYQIAEKYKLSYTMIQHLVLLGYIKRISMKKWQLDDAYFKDFDSAKFRENFYIKSKEKRVKNKYNNIITRAMIYEKYGISQHMFYYLVDKSIIQKCGPFGWKLDESYFKDFDLDKLKQEFYAQSDYNRLKHTRKFILKKYDLTKNMFYELVRLGHIRKVSNQKWQLDDAYFKDFDSAKFRENFYAVRRQNAIERGKRRFLDPAFREYHRQCTSKGTKKAYDEHGDEMAKKAHETMKQNNTLTSSKSEIASYNFLLTKYSKDDIVQQYKSDKYPFKCDFYIKSLDLYIECHYSHYHNYRPFDKNNEEHIKEVELLREKHIQRTAKTGKATQYETIAYTWSELDVRKRQCAIDNNLNWHAFYSMEDLISYFTKV